MPCLFINMKHLYWKQAGIILAGKTKVKRHSKDASQRVSGPLVIQLLQEHITIRRT
ncbi:hypothetical protein HMPREF1608_04758 [Escherichia coli 908525]|nr:hypothetical protein HMPREF1608_04758 [Escherichia coli 908525]